MKVKLERSIHDEGIIEISRLKVLIDDETEFIIKVNRFGSLVINKRQYGSRNSSIQIIPCVSNEIEIK